MNICIIDCSAPESKDVSSYVSNLITYLQQFGCVVKHHPLCEMNIYYCRGCFGCWVKTPGKCVIKDDMEEIYPSIINADLLLMISPLKIGFINEVLKKTEDRMIPLLHPYFEMIKNESHHSKRYHNYPLLALMVSPEIDTDDEDLKMVEQIHHRFATNFMTELIMFFTTDMNSFDAAKELTSYLPVKI